MTASPLPTLGLIGLLDTFALHSPEAVYQRVVDTAAESYESEIVALVAGGRVVAATGIGGSDQLGDRVVEVAAAATQPTASEQVELPVVGPVHAVAVPVGADDWRLVLARTSGAFDPGELRGCRVMIRIMRLALRTIRAFDHQVQISERLSVQVEENLRLADELQHRHADFLARVLDIQELLNTSSVSALEAIVLQAGALLDGAVVGLQLLRGDGMLELRHITPNIRQELIDALSVVPPGQGVGHLAVERGELVVLDSYSDLATVVPGLEDLSDFAVAASPVRRRHEVVGALTVCRARSAGPFGRHDLETISLLAGFASVALTDALTLEERQRALELAEWQATHDALTGLANRRLVLDIIGERLGQRDEQGNREAGPLTVLYLDIDRFKSVNDLYGHHVGDQLIREVAERIDTSTRPDDLVGRLAGDEFIVVCGDDIDEDRADTIAERIRAQLSGSITIEGRAVPISVSIGMATSDGMATADDVINAADVAMYQAKSSGRNCVGRYDEALQSSLRRQAELVERLEQAVATGAHFHLAYQPIVALASCEVVGYESLLRWVDPVLGRVPPDVFIPIAEEVGLITRIDDWVLSTALREAVEHDAIGSLSVNVSPAWLTGDRVAERVARMAANSTFPLERLSIEVTERAALAANVTTVLSDLRHQGVRILLDDFGTGYSSLAYVQTLEFDVIKIDRAFLMGVETDRHAAAILEAVVTLTDRLGAVAVAEGVETAAHAELLTALGCRLAQGYYFGRPTPAPEGLRAHHRAGDPLALSSQDAPEAPGPESTGDGFREGSPGETQGP